VECGAVGLGKHTATCCAWYATFESYQEEPVSEEHDKQLRDAISAHPMMKRLQRLCDELERVLKRKAAGASSEPDGKTGSEGGVA